MDFFLNWCINCGKRSEYLYCCKECRLNDLKKKNSTVNDNNYTLEFKNRKHSHTHNFYKIKSSPMLSGRPSSPFLTINIPQSMNPQNISDSASSDSSSNSDYLPMSTVKTNVPSQQQLGLSIYSSPPKDAKSPMTQRPRYYVQTFHNKESVNQTKSTQQPQLLSPLSGKDNMEFENTSNNIFTVNQMFSEEEVNENSSRWYWSSSDDEDDDE
ncbi:hypothetical protein PIROE2DRAFT_14888 [Piromyces sp. E2]|nr:hypothetical protein PIROE2DRAFT_14888 [Piromyces sp. E2]|eukprot:OUM59554.1 hypothetical protein PIROE2DRAFT_14888 [Piromyces sp. E2]